MVPTIWLITMSREFLGGTAQDERRALPVSRMPRIEREVLEQGEPVEGPDCGSGRVWGVWPMLWCGSTWSSFWGKGFRRNGLAAQESSSLDPGDDRGSVRAGDIISLSGRVVSKREVDRRPGVGGVRRWWWRRRRSLAWVKQPGGSGLSGGGWRGWRWR